MRKPMLSFVLAAALLAGLAGCTKQPQPAPQPAARTGAFAETDITPGTAADGEIFLTAVAADGTLHCLRGKHAWSAADLPDPVDPALAAAVHWYTLAPGSEEWTERTDHALAQVVATLAGESFDHAWADAAMDAEGTLYWRVYGHRADPQPDGTDVGLTWFKAEDGTAVKIDPPRSGELALRLPDPASARHDPQTGRIARCGETVLTQSVDGTLHAFDAAGSELALDLPRLDGGGTALLCGWGDAYYLYDEQNEQLSRCLLGGTTQEIILDGTRCALGAPDTELLYWVCAAGPGDTLYLTCRQSDAYHLYRYQWDENKQRTDEGTVTVFSLYENRTVQNAAAELQNHSGVTVEYSCALTRDDLYAIWSNAGANAPAELETRCQDALRLLNTRLLAGEGPDVLILDGMDTAALRRQGVLADLDGILDAETAAALLPNLAAACRDENGLWALPAGCYPWVVGGRPEVIAELDSMSDIAAAIGQGAPVQTSELYGLQGAQRESVVCRFAYWRKMFETFYQLYSDQIWRDGALNTAVYGHLLEVTGRIAAHDGLLNANGEDDGAAAEQALTADMHYPAGYYGVSSGTLSDYYNGYGTFFCDTLDRPLGGDWPFAYHAALTGTANTGALRALAGDGGETAVQPLTVAAVNASSQNKELAARFLGTLFGSAAQAYSSNIGLPARADVLAEAWANGLEECGTACDTDIVALVGSLDVKEYDAVLQNAAWQGAWTFYSGGTLDEACAAANAAAALKLAER